ncbi:MAG: RagB/SusD family nutrient uptake outer membrane protein [Prevotellaceae bacterium]|jgi:hypothetical protein|nr:RagB/SusD family nutrient uptake outer membrane protein [Prevotellaceae bacterium]
MKLKGKLISAAFAVIVVSTASCDSYLDVVPDNTMKLENIFATKEEAYNALAKIYSYLPNEKYANETSYLLGDEYIGRIDASYANNTGVMRGIRIMRGLQNVNDPIMGYWSGTNGGKRLYEGIRQCNVFLQYIGMTNYMTEDDKKEWRAMAKFLKAYYHFLLLQRYGPIVIADEIIPPDATREQLFQRRQKVDTCFNYILRLIDEAAPSLKPMIQTTSDFGMIDQLAAKAIKARILFFRASQFFSGNMEYFGDFYDHDGNPFFPMDDDAATKRKQKEAIDALDEAITLCEQNGKGLYRYEKTAPYLYDAEDFAANPDLKTYYDLRQVITDPWNKELVWGNSNVNLYGDGEIGDACNIRLPKDFPGETDQNAFSWQWMGATYKMLERYYTKNGLPINVDRTFDYNSIHSLTKTPNPNRDSSDPMKEEDSVKYQKIRGIMQPNIDVINLYLNREMRFYANLGITGGYWRAHTYRIPVDFYQAGKGGYNPSGSGGQTDYLCSGIGIQKFVHPESRSNNWQRVQRFPYPIVRMADLYLMRAEMLNEYDDSQEQRDRAYIDLNKIRERAGIPTVEQSWGNSELVSGTYLNYHRTQRGLREIILRERSIELAFEGHRFWDALRYKKAPQEFSSAVQGWNHLGSGPATFFVLGVKQSRRFTVRDCLCPIDLNELNTNGSLIQNPGW